MESSFLYQTTRCFDSFDHPDLPAVMVFLECLTCVVQPMAHAIISINIISITPSWLVLFFCRNLLKRIPQVSLKDLMRVGHKYIAPLFDPAQSSCAICCHPFKVEEIREEFHRWVLSLIFTIKRYCCAHHNVMLFQTFAITPSQQSLHGFRSSSVRQAMTEISSISIDDLYGYVQV